MNLYIKNTSTGNVSISGDRGTPNVSLQGALDTETVLVGEVLGNVLFCDSCASLITGGDIEVRVASATGTVLSAADMESVKNGTLFDRDEDGIPDEAENLNVVSKTDIDNTDSPYTVLATDTVVQCDVTAALIAITLPAGIDGQVYEFKDTVGSALTNNITITPDGTETIEGAATYTINADYGGAKMYYDEATTDWKLMGAASGGGGGITDADFAGTALGRLTRTGASAYAVIQDNLAAAVAPVVGDDNTGGYGIGSLWFDTTAHRLYTCTDASTGAAIWIGYLAKNTVAAIAPVVGDDDSLGYSVGSMWFDTTIVPPRAYLCTSAATGAAVWRQVNHFDNLAAAVAPAVGNDVTEGYDVGSKWIDTTADTAYICLDATTGAAVWVSIDVTAVTVAAATAVMDADFAGATLGTMVRTGVGAYAVIQDNLIAIIAPVVGDDDTAGYEVGSKWIDTVLGDTYVCVDATTGAAVWVLLNARETFDARAGAAVTQDLRLFRAMAPGRIVAANAECRVIPAAGESMTFDVMISVGGVGAFATALTGVITLDNTAVSLVPEAGVIDGTANTFAVGDVIMVRETYVAGGGPTPMLDTVSNIMVQYS